MVVIFIQKSVFNRMFEMLITLADDHIRQLLRYFITPHRGTKDLLKVTSTVLLGLHQFKSNLHKLFSCNHASIFQS